MVYPDLVEDTVLYFLKSFFGVFLIVYENIHYMT